MFSLLGEMEPANCKETKPILIHALVEDISKMKVGKQSLNCHSFHIGFNYRLKLVTITIPAWFVPIAYNVYNWY